MKDRRGGARRDLAVCIWIWLLGVRAAMRAAPQTLIRLDAYLIIRSDILIGKLV